ncbi:MAG: 1-deoxy-D-xylulose-5-phosphate reductoisomerase [Bacteroidota bacterium]
MSTYTNIAILGSTGSIGTQALEVIDQQPDRFGVAVLTANNRAELLVEQALRYKPESVVIGNPDHYEFVHSQLDSAGIAVHTGRDALDEVVTLASVDMVLTALVGFSGLRPTLAAIRAKKPIALANKETLVVAGELVMKEAKTHQVPIIPVDSEHSALFQCMVGESYQSIEKLILTASGGPFRGFSYKDLQSVSPQQALKHPNWEMGSKITIDSASMMNKGLEVIEAYWLFQIPANRIEVIVHPQSIIHSIVQFEDGSMKAQMGLPDMRLPIQYALAFPQRLPNTFPRFEFLKYPSLTFEQVDTGVFKNLALAFEALNRGGNMPCVLNAANEVTNQLFREGQISFTDMAKINEAAMEQLPFLKHPQLEDFLETDSQTRKWVLESFTARM